MKKYTSLATACLFALNTGAQIISTIAGTGIAGYSGDGGPATSAKLNFCHGLSTDGGGTIVVTDHDNNRVRYINTSGVITTFAGIGVPSFSGDGGMAASAGVYQPFDVLAANDGDWYIADTWNNRVRKVSGLGIITTIAGNGSYTSTGDGGPATAASMMRPSGIALDATGNLYIADQYSHRVRKVNLATGIITTIAGTGTFGYSGDGGPATAARLYYPNFLYVDAADNLYITDNGNHRIRKVNTSGIITTFAGTGVPGFSGDGGPATAAQLYYPAGMTMDAGGNAYIVDHMNHRIRKVDATGSISTIAGNGIAGYGGDGGPATLAQLNRPTDIAVLPTGDLVVCDRYNSRLRLITMSYPPVFTGGATYSLVACVEAAEPLDLPLTVSDASTSGTETWTVLTSPLHGSLSGFPATAPCSGGLVSPPGTSYTSAVGYTGADSFVVRVFDGSASDTIKVLVTVSPTPLPAVISGDDTICVGFTATLSASLSGGTWISTNPSVATVLSGVVTGVAVGIDTIRYTVSSSCGSLSSEHPISVVPATECVTSGIETALPDNREIIVMPNPGNGAFTVLVPGAKGRISGVLYDLLGRAVREFSFEGDSISLENNLQPGNYILSVSGQNGKWQQRVVIQSQVASL
ncbi:MAG: T9SS type A sorting domain-containing protein [Taibaiella sp.]|nr:T9SS type A sorting domain-containing protein [Taibaiella sp.]